MTPPPLQPLPLAEKCWCLGISTVESVETRCPWNQSRVEVIYGTMVIFGRMSGILFAVQHMGGGNIHEPLLWGESQGCVTEKGDRCSRKMFDARQPCLFNFLTRSSFGGLISTCSLWPPRQTEPADNKRHIRGDSVQTCCTAGDACRVSWGWQFNEDERFCVNPLCHDLIPSWSSSASMFCTSRLIFGFSITLLGCVTPKCAQKLSCSAALAI